MDRRDFILGAAASGIVGNFSHDAVLRTAQEVWALVSNSLPRESTFSERLLPDASTAVKTLFSGKGEILKIAGGRAHYQYPKIMHPDDQWACELVVEYAKKLAEKHHYDPDVGIPSWAGSFVCTGSPVSNLFTRTFLEYTYVDGTRPARGLRRVEDPTLDLPFQFELRPEIIRGLTTSPHHSPEAGKSERNWSIRHRNGHFFIPSTQDKKSDFLLISRVPNWIEPRAPHHEFKSAVTIIGGTHGVGTSSLRLLLEDIELLKSVLLRTEQYEYWQVLLTIDKMEYGIHPHSKVHRLIAESIDPNFLCEPVNV